MLYDDTAALPRPEPTRERKPLLRPRSPAINALIESLPFEASGSRSDIHGWATQLIGDVRRFVNAKGIRRGMFAPPLLSKAQADAALRAALAKGGQAND